MSKKITKGEETKSSWERDSLSPIGMRKASPRSIRFTTSAVKMV